MNKQFLGILAGDPELASLEEKVEEAAEKRRKAKVALLEHIERHGW